MESMFFLLFSDPYLRLMDPDGPKTYGSATLGKFIKIHQKGDKYRRDD